MIPRPLLALVAVALATGGCAALDPEWHRCREVADRPLLIGVQVIAEQGDQGGRATARKARAGIALYQDGGLSLVLDGSPRIVECRRLTTAEAASWADRMENLAATLGTLTADEADGELLSVLRGSDRSEAWNGVADLDEEAVEAARAVACLAYATFGDTAIRALREAGPRLSSRLRVPESCADTGAET